MNFADDSFAGVGFDSLNSLRQGMRQTGYQSRRQNFGRLNNAGRGRRGGEGGSRKQDAGEVAMRSITLNADNVVSFFGSRHYLSTFYAAPMLIAGHHYPTVEHYYEACKIYAVAGPECAMYLKDVQDPVQVKNTVKRILDSQNIQRETVNKWKSEDGLLVVRVGLMEKFRQNPKLRNQLFNTGDALLVQCGQGDRFWSTGTRVGEFRNWLQEKAGESIQFPVLVESKSVRRAPQIDGGKNLLGFMLMYVRDCLRSEYGVASRGVADKNSLMESDN
jgi:ribA/ribD-fused uncharacterized protein